MKEDDYMKVIVVGSSHGGYEAVEGLLKHYPDAEIQWYEPTTITFMKSSSFKIYFTLFNYRTFSQYFKLNFTQSIIFFELNRFATIP